MRFDLSLPDISAPHVAGVDRLQCDGDGAMPDLCALTKNFEESGQDMLNVLYAGTNHESERMQYQ